MTVAAEKHLFANLARIATHAVGIRHDLHRHPEIGYEELYTSGVVCRELARLGIAYQNGIAKTGVVAMIRGKGTAGEKRCVALRADMDALPVTEETGLEYASERPGFMHACGHDGHMAVLLGAAAVLQENADRFAGTVKLIFQPAEEGGCGAEVMVKEGVLENPKVEAIFGLHGWPMLKVGMVATKPGALLASVDGFTIRISGRGGHAAAPHTAVDPIVCGAAIVQGLQTIVSREADPTDASVLTVSQFKAGTAFNVIPDSAELNGTIRALSQSRREATIASLERIARGIGAAHRCEVAFEYFGTTPCTNNTPEMAGFVKETVQRVLGAKAFVEAGKPAMWGEDFAFYLEKVPGCFFVLGVQPQDAQSHPMLHNPRYNFTDEAVPVGIRMMVELALGYLDRGGSK